MNPLIFIAMLLAVLGGGIFSTADAAPTKTSAKTTKSTKKSTATISPAAAEKQLKAMGINKAQYDEELATALLAYDDFKKLRLLVAAGADITTPRTWDKLAELAQPGDSPKASEALRQEMPPLTAALLISNERAARLLLKRPGISIKNWSPLEQAICKGKAEQITELLNEGADPFARGDSGTLPICLAAILGKKACIEAILSHPKSKEQAAKAREKREELLSRLEIKAAYIVSTAPGSNDHIYGSYIRDAFYEGSIAQLTLSLMYPKQEWEAPARGNEQITTWRYIFNEISACDFNSFQGRTKLNILMKIAKPDLPEAYIAVLKNDLKALQECLASTSVQTLDGEPFALEPILFYVIKTGNIKALQILLKAGVSPDQHTQRVTNGVFENMLMIAASCNQFEIFKAIIDAGADINNTADHGSTFLSDAIRWKRVPKFIEYIINHPHFSDQSVHPFTLAVLRKDYTKIKQFVDEVSKKGDMHAYNDRCSIADYIAYCINTNEIKAIKIMAPALYGTEQQKRVIDEAREQKREDIVKILQGDQ